MPGTGILHIKLFYLRRSTCPKSARLPGSAASMLHVRFVGVVEHSTWCAEKLEVQIDHHLYQFFNG